MMFSHQLISPKSTPKWKKTKGNLKIARWKQHKHDIFTCTVIPAHAYKEPVQWAVVITMPYHVQTKSQINTRKIPMVRVYVHSLFVGLLPLSNPKIFSYDRHARRAKQATSAVIRLREAIYNNQNPLWTLKTHSFPYVYLPYMIMISTTVCSLVIVSSVCCMRT